MNLKIFQKGFHYAQDGQGNRLVYHLQGCNMKCKWCANPEGMKMEGVICTDKEWLTDGLCPEGAVRTERWTERYAMDVRPENVFPQSTGARGYAFLVKKCQWKKCMRRL